MSFPRYRWVFAAAAVLLAFGVGLSRVYLAVHWSTDVAGAGCSGSPGWLLPRSWCCRFRRSRGSPVGQLSLETRPHERALVAQNATALVAYPVSSDEVRIDSKSCR